jgi:stage II sporulation protein AB (anti-sigma F factor)
MPLSSTITWDFAATREAPGRARHAVSEYARRCGMRDGPLGALALCVSEAVTNAVLHAYNSDRAAGRVRVHAECHPPEHVRVRVRDEGSGLAPRLDSPGIGLGLPIIAQMADSSEIRVPEDGGTEVCMRFRLDDA